MLYTSNDNSKTGSSNPSAGPSRNSGGSDKLATKWCTIYVIGDSQAKRMAAHARAKLLDPRLSDDITAYDIAEVGEAVGTPNKNDGQTWLAILEAAKMEMEDIVLFDIFNVAAWEDVGSNKANALPDPHMVAPIVPCMSNSLRMQDAIKAIRTVIDALPNGILAIILPPHARYLAGPCCLNHMGQWNSRTLPGVLFESITALDSELFEIFKNDNNTCYIKLEAIKEAAGHKELDFPHAWAAMRNRSNVYWTNKVMKVVMELSIALAWEGKRLDEAKSGKPVPENRPALAPVEVKKVKSRSTCKKQPPKKKGQSAKKH